MSYQYLSVEIVDKVATVWLNRPEVHNAFNSGVIDELTTCLKKLGGQDSVRVVVLAGRGRSFSAGADLNWMKQAGEASFEDNEADAMNLANMLHTLATLPKPTIARVHGAALGGGMGLASACDVCVASHEAKFATSEVRLGLAPSTISPYVIRAIGARQATRYFLTAERMDAQTAHAIGLVHEVCDEDKLDEVIATIAHAICQGAPYAQMQAKKLIDEVADKPINEALLKTTARHIANLRGGDEAKEGLRAFLNKDTPAWQS